MDQIIQNILNHFRKKIDSLLANCESEIEKSFLIKFLEEFFYNSSGLYDVSFLSEAYDVGIGNHPLSTLIKEDENLEVAYSQTKRHYIYGLFISHNFFDYSFSIIPQHKILIGEIPEIYFRLDFAILGHFEDPLHKSGKKEFKIFIECDGHEWHHTRKQRQNDNERMACLTQKGWIPFRYTGNQIFHSDFSASRDFKKFIIDEIAKGYKGGIKLT